MPVLWPPSVRSRARRQMYREVPSTSRHFISFEHNRKIGCGGWRNKYGPVRVDVDYEEGKVVTHLNHNMSGITHLARDVFSHNELEDILRNPRIHTSRGRHVAPYQDTSWRDLDTWDDGMDSGYMSALDSWQEYTSSARRPHHRTQLEDPRSRSMSPNQIMVEIQGQRSNSCDSTRDKEHDREREVRWSYQEEKDRGRVREERRRYKEEQDRERDREDRKRYEKQERERKERRRKEKEQDRERDREERARNDKEQKRERKERRRKEKEQDRERRLDKRKRKDKEQNRDPKKEKRQGEEKNQFSPKTSPVLPITEPVEEKNRVFGDLRDWRLRFPQPFPMLLPQPVPQQIVQPVPVVAVVANRVPVLPSQPEKQKVTVWSEWNDWRRRRGEEKQRRQKEIEEREREEEKKEDIPVVLTPNPEEQQRETKRKREMEMTEAKKKQKKDPIEIKEKENNTSNPSIYNWVKDVMAHVGSKFIDGLTKIFKG